MLRSPNALLSPPYSREEIAAVFAEIDVAEVVFADVAVVVVVVVVVVDVIDVVAAADGVDRVLAVASWNVSIRFAHCCYL